MPITSTAEKVCSDCETSYPRSDLNRNGNCRGCAEDRMRFNFQMTCLSGSTTKGQRERIRTAVNAIMARKRRS